jgi:hypothetical protein
LRLADEPRGTSSQCARRVELGVVDRKDDRLQIGMVRLDLGEQIEAIAVAE